MPFPESPRVFYQKNPLAEVICQVRFPAILRVTTQPPDEFQEAIRERFPLFEERREPLAEIGLPAEVAELVQQRLSLPAGGVSYRFASADGRWSVSLTREFLSLTDNGYVRWEDFRGHLKIPTDALEGVYKPAFYNRVGLRYRDVIRRSALGLEGVPWNLLLMPHIAGELTNAEVAGAISQVSKQIILSLNDVPGSVKIQHGLGLAEYPDGKREEVYIIDCDFYVADRISLGDIFGTLDNFNKRAGWLFRWCISERLADAMEPRTV